MEYYNLNYRELSMTQPIIKKLQVFYRGRSNKNILKTREEDVRENGAA